MTGSTPANNENPPSPPFSKGGLGGFESYFLTKQESSLFNVFWTPAFAGVTV